jgi:hypothetical protein
VPVAAVVCALACGQILGVDDYRTGGAGAAGGTPEFADEACGSCMREHCPDAMTACAADRACRPLQACLVAAAPTDAERQHACYLEAGSTGAPIGDVAMCAWANCSPACGGLAGEAVARGPRCADDIDVQCRDLLSSCASDRACTDFVRCTFAEDCILVGKRNPDCLTTCLDRSDYYTPESKLNAVANCMWYSAYSTCFDDLSCRGTYTWRGSADASVSVRVIVHEGPAAIPDVTGPPVPNLEIIGCYSGSDACLPVLGRATTGPDGVAELKLGGPSPYWFELRRDSPEGPASLILESGRPLGNGASLSFSVGDPSMTNLNNPGNPYTLGHWDPTRGGLTVQLRDCAGVPVRGAEISLDDEEGTHRAWLTAQLALVYEFAEDAFVTHFFGVKPGVRTITARIAGEVVAEGRAVVKQNSFTMYPWLQLSPKK